MFSKEGYQDALKIIFGQPSSIVLYMICLRSGNVSQVFTITFQTLDINYFLDLHSLNTKHLQQPHLKTLHFPFLGYKHSLFALHIPSQSTLESLLLLPWWSLTSMKPFTCINYIQIMKYCRQIQCFAIPHRPLKLHLCNTSTNLATLAFNSTSYVFGICVTKFCNFSLASETWVTSSARQ